MRHKEAQRYYVPDLKQDVKVEQLGTQVHVANFPSGPERIGNYEMRSRGWVHLGPWEAPRKEALTLAQYCEKYGHAWTDWMNNIRSEGEWKICKRCLDLETRGEI
jgi:hypothetical protein